jgi:hypothetical protein
MTESLEIEGAWVEPRSKVPSAAPDLGAGVGHVAAEEDPGPD